jgi:hypothetical protein
MTVFELKADANNYEVLALADSQGWGMILDHLGGLMGHAWEPPEVEILRDEEHTNRPRSDFPSLGGVLPVFSRRAVDALRDVLTANGEILPLVCAEGEYFAYNTLKVVDALDEERSAVKRFKDGGVMRVVHHEFLPEKLHGVSVFKIPQTIRSRTYVTDEFVRRVREAGLVGFNFIPVWALASEDVVTAA